MRRIRWQSRNSTEIDDARFQPLIFGLCIATSIACTWLLYRGWRRTRTPLLFWSAICFVFLAPNNLVVFADLVILPERLGAKRSAGCVSCAWAAFLMIIVAIIGRNAGVKR